MAAYTIADLANALRLNTSGFRVNITSTTYVGLVDSTFIIHHDSGSEEHVSPKDIITRCEEIIGAAHVVSDSELFDLCQSKTDSVLDEDTFFEMDLGGDPVATMNDWMVMNEIELIVTRCVEKDDNVSWEVA